MIKKSIIVAIVILTTMSFTSIERKAYKAVISESTAAWVAYKAGGQHNGTIGIKEGFLVVDDNMVVSGSFTIEMNSIKVLDTDKKKLLNHLKSDDFFDVEKFPIATFIISGSSIDGDKMMIKGKLTIKELTEEIKFLASITKNEKGQMVLESETFKVNRAKFNVTYKSKTFFNNLKDKFIYDEFDMKVKVVFSEIEK
ncbi:MAG: YceI family protein [Flavobacteriaceae bacterium]|nr:YceI family protein [Flavobacteriaceae bacterium]